MSRHHLEANDESAGAAMKPDDLRAHHREHVRGTR